MLMYTADVSSHLYPLVKSLFREEFTQRFRPIVIEELKKLGKQNSDLRGVRGQAFAIEVWPEILHDASLSLTSLVDPSKVEITEKIDKEFRVWVRSTLSNEKFNVGFRSADTLENLGHFLDPFCMDLSRLWLKRTVFLGAADQMLIDVKEKVKSLAENIDVPRLDEAVSSRHAYFKFPAFTRVLQEIEGNNSSCANTQFSW